MLAGVAYLLTEGILQTAVTAIAGARIDLTMQAIITGLLLAVLRAIDKVLHDTGKLEKGLTQF